MPTPREVRIYPLEWTADNSQPIFVRDFRNIVVTIVGTGTINILGTVQENILNSFAGSTISNSYATIVIADLGVPNTYATTLTAAGSTKLGEVNTNLLTWIVVTRSVDTVDGFITISDNE